MLKKRIEYANSSHWAYVYIGFHKHIGNHREVLVAVVAKRGGGHGR